MKKRIIIFFLLLVNVGVAQKYSDHYYKRKTLFESEADTEGEIIFLGNSITEGGNWRVLFPDKNVINRGISGDVTDGILLRLKEVTASEPIKVFLLIGTNDLARGKSIDDVITVIDSIISQIKAESRRTKIYLQSILPVNPKVGTKFTGHKNNHLKIIEANRRLKALAQAKNISYVDVHRSMRNSKKYLRSRYTYDGLHLSEKGYVKWAKTIHNDVYK